MDLNEVITESTYIKFVEGSSKPKTKTWIVMSNYEESLELGEISWFARWRKYTFRPKNDTVFEEKCLRDIAQFCQDQTKKHKDGR